MTASPFRGTEEARALGPCAARRSRVQEKSLSHSLEQVVEEDLLLDYAAVFPVGYPIGGDQG